MCMELITTAVISLDVNKIWHGSSESSMKYSSRVMYMVLYSSVGNIYRMSMLQYAVRYQMRKILKWQPRSFASPGENDQAYRRTETACFRSASSCSSCSTMSFHEWSASCVQQRQVSET